MRSPSASEFHPVAVFGTDERRPLHPSEAQLNAKIGVLEVRGSSICTAFCVAPDAIATASHCLLGTEQTRAPDLTSIKFRIGAGNEAATSTIAGRSAPFMRRSIAAGTAKLRLSAPIEAASDWAVARLADPICRAGGLPISTLKRDDLENVARIDGVYQAAMHRDVSGQTLLFGAPCRIGREFPGVSHSIIARDFKDEDAVLLHTCDTAQGSSGSPLLIDGLKGPEVVGINVGTYIISRMSAKSSTGMSQELSLPVANTAVIAERFRAAVEAVLQSEQTASARRSPPEPGDL